MDRLIRRIEIILLVMLGLTYLAAKMHFFMRYQPYDSLAYVTEHWPFWLAMAIIGVTIGIQECVRWVLHSKA
jgi:hypothetical protein